MDGETPPPLSVRPYRSHKVPACDRCRHRKIRCDIDVPGQPCRFCRERRDTCNYTQRDPRVDKSPLHSSRLSDARMPPGNGRNGPPASREQTSATARSSKRRRQSHGGSVTVRPSSRFEGALAHFPGVNGTSPTESSLMMNPPMAEDIAILEQYLTSQESEGRSAAKQYSTISNTPGNAIVYLTVPRRRKGLRTAFDPGRTQREIIEQVLSPFTAEVRKLYFDHLHPCFPILDENTFSDLWHKNNDRISSALICDLYASAILFWNKSEVLRNYTPPDSQFIWNQAVSALQDDFTEPTISTVHAALLDMVGRPVRQVTGNIVNAGRVVTLAHSLGLHRDPTNWRATEHEKNVRIRLWWGVLIHDHWSSVGHGIPSTINRRCYDVPVPSLESLLTSNASEATQQASSSFLHFCKLSQILGDIIPFVYSLQLDSEEIWRNLRKVECALDDWAEDLPQYLRLAQSVPSGVDGSSNLWFSYLSVKVLLCRLAFKATLKDLKQTGPEARQYRLAMLRESASAVTDFVTALTDAQLQEFWMPYVSYLLVSAATVLLRCTVECGDLATKMSCVTKLVHFRDRLRRAQVEGEWDLADFCVERCHDSIQKIADALNIASANGQPQTSSAPAVDSSGLVAQMSYTSEDLDMTSEMSTVRSDVFLPTDSLDFPWETLWDSFEGPWPIQI